MDAMITILLVTVSVESVCAMADLVRCAIVLMKIETRDMKESNGLVGPLVRFVAIVIVINNENYYNIRVYYLKR